MAILADSPRVRLSLDEMRNSGATVETLSQLVPQWWRDNVLPTEGANVLDPWYSSSPMSEAYRVLVWACFHFGTARPISVKASRGYTLKVTIGSESYLVRTTKAKDHREWVAIL